MLNLSATSCKVFFSCCHSEAGKIIQAYSFSSSIRHGFLLRFVIKYVAVVLKLSGIKTVLWRSYYYPSRPLRGSGFYRISFKFINVRYADKLAEFNTNDYRCYYSLSKTHFAAVRSQFIVVAMNGKMYRCLTTTKILPSASELAAGN